MTRPKIRRGFTELTLHRRRDYLQVRDRAQAESLADAYLEEGWRSILDRDFNLGIGDDAEIRDRLISRLLHGDLFLTRDDVVRRLDRIEPSWLEPREHRDDPLAPLREPTFVAFTILHECGARYPGARLNVMLPDGEIRTVTLDGASRARLDDVTEPGICRIRPRGGPLTLPDGTPVGAPIITLQPSDTRMDAGSDASVTLRTGADHRIVVVEPVVVTPRAKCVRLSGALFALNKAFLLPDALEGIRVLKHMYDEIPDAEILVVGHTDTTGSSSRNQSLSLQRARAVVAYCQDDVETWYAFYGPDMDHSRRWGPPEDLAMLSALPRAGVPFYGPHHEEHSLPAAIGRFQEAHGLVPDCDAGPITRRAMIAAYMAVDGTTLPAGVAITAHGCGEWFPKVPTGDDVDEPENRRVEVFFFKDGVDPKPRGSTSTKGSGEYPSWLEKVEEERTFRPSEAGLGSVMLDTDIEVDHAKKAGVTFRLVSTDGAYDQAKTPQDHGVAVGGYVRIEFDGLPKGSFYTLTIVYATGTEDALFEDIPFYELSLLSAPRSDDLVDPFSTDPSDQAAREEG